jgi:hypothetical protein
MKKFILLAAILGMTSLKMFGQNIASEDASKNIGKTVTVCGKIFGGRFFEKNEKTLLNMGGAFPNHMITIVVDGAARKKFGFKPEEFYLNKDICVKGEVKDYKGKPELVVTEIKQITVPEPVKK